MPKSGCGFPRLITFFVVLSPMFLQYVLFVDFILLPELFLGPLLFVCLLERPKINIGRHGLVILYLVFVLIQTLVVWLFSNYFNPVIASTTYIRFLFYTFILIFVSERYFNVDFGAKLLVAVATINGVYGLVQFFAYNVFSLVLPWNLPFLKVRYGELLITEKDYFISTFGYRFSGVFSEPAHFSQYLGFALVFVFFYRSDGFCLSIRNRIFVSVILMLALFLSGSGTGFFIFLLISMFAVVDLSRQSKNGVILGVLFLLMLCVITSVFMYFNVSSSGLNRVLSIGDTSSFYIRVIRPLEVYYNLPVFDKLFGVGYGNYSQYLTFNGLLSDYEEAREVSWVNAAGFILVGGGFAAFSLYISYFVNLFLKSNRFNRYIIVYLIAHLFFSDLPLSLFYVTIMSFVFASYRSANAGHI